MASAPAGAGTTFPLRRRGASSALATWSSYGVALLIIGALAVFVLTRSVLVAVGYDSLGPCEASVGGVAGLGAALASISFLFGRNVVRGLLLAWRSHRHPGSVTVLPHALVIEAPGVVEGAVTIPTWAIEGIEVHQPGEGSTAASMTFGRWPPSTVLRLRQPLGLPGATAAPMAPHSAVVTPAPWVPVREVGLDVDDPAALVATVSSALADGAEDLEARDGHLPEPVARSRWRAVVPLVVAGPVALVGFGVFWASLPAGPGC